MPVPMLELKDKDGNLFYPVTKVEAVLDDNGNNIDDYIDDKVAGKTGHQILDDEGTAVAQKSKLQFENATVENVGDKTVVTPLSGVTTEPFQTAQGTTAVPMVNSFNGRQGAVSPTNGDYTADMVGAIPVQSGTQGQVLGFVSDNVIGAVDPVSGGVTSFNSRTGDITPTSGDYSIEQISATGTRGQVIGLTADNTIGVMNAPKPTYTGTAGQVLGFTATDTVGAMNIPAPNLSNYSGDINITGEYKKNGVTLGATYTDSSHNEISGYSSGPWSASGFGPVLSLPAGTYLVTYIAKMAAGTAPGTSLSGNTRIQSGIKDHDNLDIFINSKFMTLSDDTSVPPTYFANCTAIVEVTNEHQIATFNTYYTIECSNSTGGSALVDFYVKAIRIA